MGFSEHSWLEKGGEGLRLGTRWTWKKVFAELKFRVLRLGRGKERVHVVAEAS